MHRFFVFFLVAVYSVALLGAHAMDSDMDPDGDNLSSGAPGLLSHAQSDPAFLKLMSLSDLSQIVQFHDARGYYHDDTEERCDAFQAKYKEVCPWEFLKCAELYPRCLLSHKRVAWEKDLWRFKSLTKKSPDTELFASAEFLIRIVTALERHQEALYVGSQHKDPHAQRVFLVDNMTPLLKEAQDLMASFFKILRQQQKIAEVDYGIITFCDEILDGADNPPPPLNIIFTCEKELYWMMPIAYTKLPQFYPSLLGYLDERCKRFFWVEGGNVSPFNGLVITFEWAEQEDASQEKHIAPKDIAVEVYNGMPPQPEDTTTPFLPNKLPTSFKFTPSEACITTLNSIVRDPNHIFSSLDKLGVTSTLMAQWGLKPQLFVSIPHPEEMKYMALILLDLFSLKVKEDHLSPGVLDFMNIPADLAQNPHRPMLDSIFDYILRINQLLHIKNIADKYPYVQSHIDRLQKELYEKSPQYAGDKKLKGQKDKKRKEVLAKMRQQATTQLVGDRAFVKWSLEQINQEKEEVKKRHMSLVRFIDGMMNEFLTSTTFMAAPPSMDTLKDMLPPEILEIYTLLFKEYKADDMGNQIVIHILQRLFVYLHQQGS